MNYGPTETLLRELIKQQKVNLALELHWNTHYSTQAVVSTDDEQYLPAIMSADELTGKTTLKVFENFGDDDLNRAVYITAWIAVYMAWCGKEPTKLPDSFYDEMEEI